MKNSLKVLLFTLFLVSPVLAQDSYFVLIDGIPGESQDPAHTDWVDAYAIDHSQSIPLGGATGQQPSGATEFSPIAILKGTDSATVNLLTRNAQQNIIPSVVIDVCRAGQAGQECYYNVSLTNVRVSSLALAGSACVDPATSCTPAQTESVEFTFETITWKYIEFQNGAPGNTIESCWDIATNSGC